MASNLSPQAPIVDGDGRPTPEFFRLMAALTAASPGWAAATGTATRTTFDTATVSTSQLAEHVKALIDDAIAKGQLGA